VSDYIKILFGGVVALGVLLIYQEIQEEKARKMLSTATQILDEAKQKEIKNFIQQNSGN
jgi:hypothetical protein